MKEIYNVCVQSAAQPETKETLIQLFVQGGMGGMIIISLFLIALFVAAWKAPRWVKEIGAGALVFSIFWTLRGLFQLFCTVQRLGDLGFSVISGGLKLTLISTLYGLIIYFISLIIRIIQKPRI